MALKDRTLWRDAMVDRRLGWWCIFTLAGTVVAGCGSSSSSKNGGGSDAATEIESDGSASSSSGGSSISDATTEAGSISDATTEAGSISDAATEAGSISDASSEAGTITCCNKLTDNTSGCSGDAMTNDLCQCFVEPAGTSCSAVLPDAGPIVSACTGYPCCYTLGTGDCQCISAGDLGSCYGAEATCATVATANGGTVSSSCP
jgi:hypothetical protein